MSILLVQWAELVLPKVLSTDQVPLLSPPVLPARPARLTVTTQMRMNPGFLNIGKTSTYTTNFVMDTSLYIIVTISEDFAFKIYLTFSQKRNYFDLKAPKTLQMHRKKTLRKFYWQNS